MKKLMKLFLLIVSSLSSCKVGLKKGEELLTTFTNSRTELLTSLQNEESIKIIEMSNEIIRCFTQKDKTAIEELFCEQIRNRPNFNKDLDSAFDYFKCDSYNTSKIETTASGGESLEYGRRIQWYVSPDIPYIKIGIYDENGEYGYRYYAIHYFWCIINEKDKTFEGLHCITIEVLNNDKINLGEYNLLWK